MNLKSLFSATVLTVSLTACGAADDQEGTTEAAAVAEVTQSGILEQTPEESFPEESLETENVGVSDPATAFEEGTSATTAETGETAGAKPKGKFMTTYDEKRKKRFIPKCEGEMAQDLKHDQVGEACNCLFDELALTLDGIKERLNPPADKLEAANEKCLTKYL